MSSVLERNWRFIDSSNYVNKNALRVVVLISLVVSIVGSGCAPVITGFQSARLVPEDRSELMPVYAAVHERTTFNNRSKLVYRAVGIRSSGRVSANREFQFGYVHFLGPGGELGLGNIVMLGWKRSLITDRLSVVLPLGTSFSRFGIAGVAAQPTLVATLPIVDHVDLSAGMSVIASVYPGRDATGQLTIGAAFSDRSGWFTIRPEFSLLRGAEPQELLMSAGLGITIRRKTKERPDGSAN